MESSILIWSVLPLLAGAGDPNVKAELELPNTGEGEGLATADVNDNVGPDLRFADAAVTEKVGPDEAPIDPKNGLGIEEAVFNPKTEAAVETDELPIDPKTEVAEEAEEMPVEPKTEDTPEVDEVPLDPKIDEVPDNPKVGAPLEVDEEPGADPKAEVLLEEEGEPKEKPADGDFELNKDANVGAVEVCPNKLEEVWLKELGSEKDTVPVPNDVPDENGLAAEDKLKEELLVVAATEVDSLDEEDIPN